MVLKNVLQAIGNTPLIELSDRINEKENARIIMKYEGVNVGGSIKTRVSLGMIEEAEKKGLINKDSVIVETTSGNQGIGLAEVCAVKGYKLIIFMPDSVSEERKKIIRFFGAEVRLIHDNNDIGECMKKCNEEVEKLCASNKKYYFINQFTNMVNVLTHKKTTGIEILNEIDSKIDGFVVGFGTGGTITGIGEALKEKNKDMIIWVVEPEKAAILNGGKIESHQQLGIGDGIIPSILNQKLIDKHFMVTDKEAIEMAKKLAKYEGLLCGITSGTNVCGALKMAKFLGKGKTVVTILPDTAERYYSTMLFD